MIEPTIISHCERPGCGLPIQGLVAIIDGKSVCHRHTLELVEKPPPTLQERLAAFKAKKRADQPTGDE